MTLSELKDAVARLGFSPSLDDGEKLMRDAAERGVNEICALRPRTVTGSVWHLPEIPIFSIGDTQKTVQEKTFSLPTGGSYYLAVSGQGTLKISRGKASSNLTFAGTDPGKIQVTTAALPQGEGDLIFEFRGINRLRILCLAVYESLYQSASPPTAPEAPLRYDLSRLLPDFIEVTETPRMADGRALREGTDGDYVLEGSTLCLSGRVTGEVLIPYRRRLTIPTVGALPLDKEEAALLPLFCAAYVFLDEDPDKSAFYLARFREGLASMIPQKGGVATFRDLTGWG